MLHILYDYADVPITANLRLVGMAIGVGGCLFLAICRAWRGKGAGGEGLKKLKLLGLVLCAALLLTGLAMFQTRKNEWNTCSSSRDVDISTAEGVVNDIRVTPRVIQGDAYTFRVGGTPFGLNKGGSNCGIKISPLDVIIPQVGMRWRIEYRGSQVLRVIELKGGDGAALAISAATNAKKGSE